MFDILKIISVLGIMVLLLKRRWNLGIVMVVSSVILALFYLLPIPDFFAAFLTAATDRTTLSLIFALTLIRVFENVMRKKGIMQKMMDSFRGMVMDRRVLMASMPALIGLLPSMGGALFSAPMVDEASKNIDISPEKKAFVNYTFRHPWEFVLPLYPGLILASAITSYALRDLILLNLPYALCLLAGGALWGLRGIGVQKEGFQRVSRSGLLSFLPLTVILVMVIIFHVQLSITLFLVIVGLYVVLRYPPRDIIQSIKEGLSWDIISIILGVMTFKSVLNASGAVANISAFFSREGIPVLPVLFFLPFVYGLLTGLTVGFVGSTFPILLGLGNGHDIGAISFAFASGYVGVLLSPVHLCLVLTREYFKAQMTGIYKKTFLVSILIMSAAAIEYLILNRFLLAR
jgi:integral membrane protein (TIGR00529 family)